MNTNEPDATGSQSIPDASGSQSLPDEIKFKLIDAASRGDISVFEKYESQIKDVYIADYDRRTPLHLAAVEGHLELVKYLVLSLNMRPSDRDRWNNTAADEALNMKHFDVADFLQAQKTPSRQKLKSQEFEIINAASEGDLSLLKRRFSDGWDLSIADYDRRTPLHLAAAEGHRDVVTFLIRDCKVDPDVKDRWGNTPCDEAARFNHRGVVELIHKLNDEIVFDKNKTIDKSSLIEYSEIVSNETTKRHCIRINIVGHTQAGKTTLAKTLLEQDRQNIRPTNSIDIHIYEAFASKKGGWQKLTKSDDFEEHNAITLAHSVKLSYKKRKIDEKDPSKTMLSKLQVHAVEKYQSKKKRMVTEDQLPTFINIWDFGGQTIFHATHQLFHSTDSVYLLVVDLSKGMEAKLEDSDLSTTAQANIGLETIEDFCKYWIYTIHASVGSGKGKPPIFLIGTHMDEFKDKNIEDIKRIKEDSFKALKGLVSDTIQEHIQDRMFFIDNTDASSGEIAALKSQILQYVNNKEEFEHEIPKKWIPLENKLRLHRYQKYATFQDVCKFDKENLVPINDEEEIKDFLAYQHRQGAVVYFRDLKISDHVILDPQWLIDAFICVITSKEFFKGDNGDRKDLIESAIVREEFFENIWKGHFVSLFIEKKNILLDFLKQFGVIARPLHYDTEKIALEGYEFFYVPSLLTEPCKSTEELFTDTPKSIVRKTQPLQIIVKAEILPPSHYNSIISAIISKWPILEHEGKMQLFVDCCIVRLVDENDIRQAASNTDTSQKDKPDIQHFGVIKMPKVPSNTFDLTVVGVATFSSKAAKEKAEGLNAFNISSRKSDQFRRFVETSLKGCLARFLIGSGEKYEVCVRGRCQESVDLNQECVVNIKTVMQQWFTDSIETIEDNKWTKQITERDLSRLTSAIGQNWEILCLSLGVKQVQLDRINQSKEPVATRMFRALNLWRQEFGKDATWETLTSELQNNPPVSYDLDIIKTIMELAR